MDGCNPISWIWRWLSESDRPHPRVAQMGRELIESSGAERGLVERAMVQCGPTRLSFLNEVARELAKSSFVSSAFYAAFQGQVRKVHPISSNTIILDCIDGGVGRHLFAHLVPVLAERPEVMERCLFMMIGSGNLDELPTWMVEEALADPSTDARDGVVRWFIDTGPDRLPAGALELFERCASDAAKWRYLRVHGRIPPLPKREDPLFRNLAAPSLKSVWGEEWDAHPQPLYTLDELETELADLSTDALLKAGCHLDYLLAHPKLAEKQLLAAYLRGEIDRDRFVSATLVMEAVISFGSTALSWEERSLKEGASWLCEGHGIEMEPFMQQMEKASSEARRFVVVRFESYSALPPLLEQLAKIDRALGIPIIADDGSALMVIPTVEMARAALRAEFGEEAVLPLPVAGCSSAADIHRAVRRNLHDLGVKPYGVHIPHNADRLGIDRGGYTFSVHDLYHCRRASFLSRAARAATLTLAEGIESFVEKRELDKETFNALGKWTWKLIDLEVGTRRRADQSEEEHLYRHWNGLLGQTIGWADREVVKELLSSLPTGYERLTQSSHLRAV